MEPRNIVGIKIQSVERYNHINGEVLSSVRIRCEYEIFSATGGEEQDATITYKIIEHGSTDISSGTIVLVPGKIIWEGHADGTLTRNGKPVTENAECMAGITKDRVLCKVLSSVFEDEFTGYAHNYKYENGNAVYLA